MFRVDKKEFFAEFLGTLVLMVFGLAVNAQVSLGDQQYGTYLSINIGWGLAVVFGVYVAGGVTGAHINPAVTLALAVNREFPWSKVLPYMAAQFLGAFLASALIYVVYLEAIDAYEIASIQERVLEEHVASFHRFGWSVTGAVSWIRWWARLCCCSAFVRLQMNGTWLRSRTWPPC